MILAIIATFAKRTLFEKNDTCLAKFMRVMVELGEYYISGHWLLNVQSSFVLQS